MNMLQIAPLVSVCMPAYNAEKYIQAAIDSILAQTYKNIELIVVNDGSNDGTEAILKSYGNKIFYVTQENSGQTTTANRALSLAKGKYVKFFDADDILSKRFIESQVNILNGSDSLIATAKWGRFFNDDLNTFTLNPETVWRDLKPIDWLVESLQNGPNMMQCGLFLIPKKILDKIGGWDQRLSLINDFEFFIRVLLSADGLKFSDQSILYYRSGVSGTVSNQTSRIAYESAYLSTNLGVDKLLSFENSSRVKYVSANILQLWAYSFYPIHKDLYLNSIERVKQLGGSTYSFPCGGFTKLLSTILGWKIAKKIKIFFHF